MNRGFTLIETVIYIGLFSFIMASILFSVYAVVSGNARSQMKAMVSEEGSFLLGKIDWALTGAQSAGIGGGGNTLSIVKYGGSSISIALSGSDLTIARGAGSPVVLNNTNVDVSCLPGGCFTRTVASGEGINPESIEAEFTVSGKTSDGLSFSQDFYTVKYLRK